MRHISRIQHHPNYWSSTTYAGYPYYALSVYFGNGGFGGVDKYGSSYVRCVRGGQSATALTDNGNGTVTDNKTGLVWQQGEPGYMLWGSALSYCEGLSLGGNTDWRLPNIKELESITDDTRYSPAIDTLFFPGAKASYYWSSTTFAGGPSGAWDVAFDDSGVVDYGKGYGYYVRCVRGGQFSADLYISSMSASSSANSGDTISVSDTTNKSGVSLVGATTTKIYFSKDNKYSAGDTELGSRAVGAFGAGSGSSSGSTDVTIPINTCTKTYYLIAKTDANGNVSEWNEGNNNRAISIAITRPDPSADLYISSVTAPGSANAGDTISVSDTTNKSGCAAGASTTRVYLSKYTSGYGGIEIGSGRAVLAFTSNPVAQTNSGSISGTIPYGGCTGSCYIVVKVDADGAITEWNEGNNKKAVAITINP